MLTNQQIVTLATQIAKCPGMVVQAGEFYNNVLEDLFIKRDLKMLRATQLLTVQGGTNGPFPLETDYERTYDLFYLIPTTSQTAGLPVFLNPVGRDTFDSEYKDPSLSNYPTEFTTDLSIQAQGLSGTAGYLYIYPQSSGQITLTHRYMQKQPAIVNPQSSVANPWFPSTDYLIRATAARLMELTDDDRMTTFYQMAEAMLQPYLIQDGDEQQVVHEVKLDPRRFRINRSLRPTKVTD